LVDGRGPVDTQIDNRVHPAPGSFLIRSFFHRTTLTHWSYARDGTVPPSGARTNNIWHGPPSSWWCLAITIQPRKTALAACIRPLRDPCDRDRRVHTGSR
jgi:hypothetical protein